MRLLKTNDDRIIQAAKWCSLIFLMLFSPSLRSPAQQPIAKEYQIKAVFLFNFTQFVQWPADAFPSADAPLVIGVLGKDPFGDFLEETVKGEKVESHNLVVQHYKSVNDVRPCHILFVAVEGNKEMREALEKVAPMHALTVSDSDGFARMGGMVSFFSDQGRIRLRINVDPVGDAGLVISSKLLRLAEIVPARNN